MATWRRDFVPYLDCTCTKTDLATSWKGNFVNANFSLGTPHEQEKKVCFHVYVWRAYSVSYLGFLFGGRPNCGRVWCLRAKLSAALAARDH